MAGFLSFMKIRRWSPLLVGQFVNADGTLSTGPHLIRGDAQNLAVASRLNGAAVVVWEDHFAGGVEPNIQLAVVNAQGANVTAGGELDVNGALIDNSPNRDPDVATFANGQSIIVWQRDFSISDHDIQARILKADGSGFTTTDAIGIDVTGAFSNEPVVAASGNKALIAYSDIRGGGTTDIRAILFNAATGTFGNSIVIANKSTTLQHADVAALSDGRYVVVYEELAGNGNIFARLVNASGNPVGAEIVVANSALNIENFARVAALPDGGFVVTWDNGSSPTGFDAFARRFLSDGTPGGDAFRLSTVADGSTQIDPAIAINGSGRAFVAFDDYFGHAGDGDPPGIRGGAFQAMTEIINGTLGNDTITTYNLGETINAGPGDDIVKSMGGNDIVNAGDGDDVVEGGSGNDNLKGERDADTINGGAGNDSLNGGKKKGTLTGGIGLDSFVFDAAVKKGNKQTIADFTPVDDTIVLDASKFKKLDPGPLKGKHFFKGSPDDGNDYVGIKGNKVIYDKNGDGDGGDTVIFVLDNKPDGFSKGDILVVA